MGEPETKIKDEKASKDEKAVKAMELIFKGLANDQAERDAALNKNLGELMKGLEATYREAAAAKLNVLWLIRKLVDSGSVPLSTLLPSELKALGLDTKDNLIAAGVKPKAADKRAREDTA